MTSFALVCFSLLALSSQHFLANADLITKICDRTLCKDVCNSEFAAVPESKTADLHGLAKIALDLTLKQANEIHSKIQNLSNPSDDVVVASSDSAIQQRLNDCSENYQDAIEQFEDVQKALSSQSYFDVSAWITAATSDAQSCEDGFKGLSNQKSPLTDLNNKFISLCNIVLTISDFLDAKA